MNKPLENPLLTIFNHFGEAPQIEKLREEVEEFIEAVLSGDKEHMEEEYADVMVCMTQFFYGKELDENNVLGITSSKVVRTIERINSGYYEGGEQIG